MTELEVILEPDLQIIDPHHHLWESILGSHGGSPVPHPIEVGTRLRPRYLLDEFMTDIRLGHDIRSTVYIQAGTGFYRAGGPPALRPVGETVFASGVADLKPVGANGPVALCAGIVGHADLTIGADVVQVLEAHIDAAGGRFRGIRQSAAWDADPEVMGPFGSRRAGLYGSDRFREGFAALAPLGLSFDAWLLEPQLPELTDLARAFPETPIVLDHMGTPLGLGSYAGRQGERFDAWRESIRRLARHPNVMVKLGGLGMPQSGLGAFQGLSSTELAALWAPYIHSCIEAFGVERCMFESNFPAEAPSGGYDVIWNAFKRVAAGFSADEKVALFSQTAARFFRLQDWNE